LNKRKEIVRELCKIARNLIAKRYRFICIINDQGMRLCGDKRWRDFAMFGTSRSTVKTYRSLGAAKRVAKQVHGKVVKIEYDDNEGDSYTMDASGKIVHRFPTPNKPDYESVEHLEPDEFVVADYT